MRRLFAIWPLALSALVLVSAWAAPGVWFTTRTPGLPAGARVLVVVPAAWLDDAGLALAVGDLSSYLRSTYGATADLIADTEVVQLPPLAVVVGGANNRWLQSLLFTGQLSLPDLGREGYVIRSLDHGGQPLVVVSGPDILGNVYGLLRLVEMSRLSPSGFLTSWQVVAEPAMTLRAVSDPLESSYPTPEQALRWGFNAIFVEPWPSLVLYDGFDPALVDRERFGAERAWVEENRRRTRERITQARRLHLQVISWGDVPSFPRQALALYGPEVGPERFCLDRPRTRQMLTYALDEVLRDFDVDYLMVRTGENYPLGHLVGNPVRDPACGSGSLDTRAVVSLIYDRVVTAHGKTYIQRAWDLEGTGMHANPTAPAVLAGIPTDGLVLSYKHTRTDFWRYNVVNPNFGPGPFTLMAEFQAAREYEGKGAFPNYLGVAFANGGTEVRPAGGMSYIRDQGVRYVWVWAKGGGWGGPRPQSDLWVDNNVYALSRLAWDPRSSPAQMALDWSSLRFGPAAAPALARLLLKSADVPLYAFYTGPAARRRGDWAPNNLWVRDDVVRGGGWLADLYSSIQGPGELAAALAEKELALRIVDSMIDDYRLAMPDIADRQQAEEGWDTLLYERALVQALARYFSGMFYYYQWIDSGENDTLAQQRALAELRAWEPAWQYYQEVAAHLPGVATPYRNESMVETVAVALAHLAKR